MPTAKPDSEPRARLREILEALDDVEAVFLSDDDATLWIIGSPALRRNVIAPQAVAALSDAGFEGAAVEIRCVPGSERRVRLLAVERIEEGEHSVRVRVALEWQRREVVGELAGARSEPIELRTAALAALRAIDQIVEGEVQLRLTGIKRFRAFDTDLVAASVLLIEEESRRLVGTVIETQGGPHAAVTAVLSALNRVLGNYLIRSE